MMNEKKRGVADVRNIVFSSILALVGFQVVHYPLRVRQLQPRAVAGARWAEYGNLIGEKMEAG
jgi:hypothetical protein